MEPAKFSITHTADSSMKKVIWKKKNPTKKQTAYYSLQEANKKNYNLDIQELSTCYIMTGWTHMDGDILYFIKKKEYLIWQHPESHTVRES